MKMLFRSLRRQSAPALRSSAILRAAAAVELLEGRTLLSASGPFPRELVIDTIPPQASIQPVSLANRGDLEFFFTVVYTDNLELDALTVGDDDILVTGPNGFSMNAVFAGDRAQLVNGPTLNALYSIAGPATQGFSDFEAGTYTVSVDEPSGATPGPVFDLGENQVPNGVIGTFELAFPPIPGPDLAISGVTYPAGQYAAGGSILAQGIVKASGDLPADPFQVVIGLRSPLNVPDIVLSTTSFSELLDPGDSLPFKISALIPSDVPAGEYFLAALVVPSNDVEGIPLDIDLSNNAFFSETSNVIIAPPPPAVPVIGGLDPSFGTNGVVRTETMVGSTAAVAVQADGKTIAVGDSSGTATGDFGVTRLNADGTIDTTFGGAARGGPIDGTVFTDVAGRDDRPCAVQILADGKFLVLGTSSLTSGSTDADFAVARYNADGSLDTTFGTNGIVIVDMGVAGPAQDQATALTLLPDGRFIISGRTENGASGTDFALARFTANGAPDTTFGGTGKVLTDFGGGDDSANAVAYDAARDQLVVAGSTTAAGGGATTFAVARYNADGSLDAKFGGTGRITTAILGVDDEAFAVAIGPKGEVVAAGAASNAAGTSTDFAVVRYTIKGLLDKKFGGGDGITTIGFGQAAAANQLQIAADGSVLVAGGTVSSLGSVDPAHISVALAQLTPAGLADGEFGVAGINPGTTILNFDSAGATSVSGLAALDGGAAAPLELTASQQALAALARQKAIAATLAGKLVVVATSGDETAIGQIAGSGPDLTGSVVAVLKTPVVGGATKGTATVTITDAGNRPAVATANITLFASLDPNVDAGDVQLAALTNRRIKLKPAQAKGFKAKFVVPASLAEGNYFIVARIDPGTSLTQVSDTNDNGSTQNAVPVAAPVLDFSGPPLASPPAVARGAKTVYPVTVTNDGNIVANGTIDIRVVAADPANVAADVVLANMTGLKLKLNPGASKTFKIKALIPATIAPGSYILKATLAGGLATNDPTPENNVLTAGGMLVVT